MHFEQKRHPPRVVCEALMAVGGINGEMLDPPIEVGAFRLLAGSAAGKLVGTATDFVPGERH
jgi:hypothetical protein